MIAAIFDHHHQTSNIQHEIAFRHAVQMVNENRWVLRYVDIFLAICLAEVEWCTSKVLDIDEGS